MSRLSSHSEEGDGASLAGHAQAAGGSWIVGEMVTSPEDLEQQFGKTLPISQNEGWEGSQLFPSS